MTNLRRVLIVDDMPAVREALRWVLEETTDLIVVGEAHDGVEALEMAARLRPDIVVLDIELPRLDGYAVTRMLKARAQPPLIIFLTVHSDTSSRQRGKDVGVDAFVEKGAGWARLLAQMRQLKIFET